ncbi:MAG: helix-turn-helix domain-containing protein [Janthinobacterium lividum]
MKAWKFDVAQHVNARDPAETFHLWQDVLTRLSLPSSRPLMAPADFFGRVTCLVSPLGIEMARIDAAAQEISGRYIRQPDGIWLTQLLKGDGTLSADERTIPMQAGDIAYGPVATNSTLVLPTDFSLLYVRLPRLALHPRLLGPAPVRVGVLPRTSGIKQIFAGMLGALAETLDDLSPAQLRPIELSISEFLIGAVLSDVASNPVRAASSVRIALFHRICQTIEAELGDPELSLTKVAKQQGISPRNMQKLFELGDQSFGQYLRSRRLERARADLGSPLQAHLSISEICFRWGFNDAAHFSRAFREQFATTPRAWRNAQRADDIAPIASDEDE